MDAISTFSDWLDLARNKTIEKWSKGGKKVPELTVSCPKVVAEEFNSIPAGVLLIWRPLSRNLFTIGLTDTVLRGWAREEAKECDGKPAGGAVDVPETEQS